jgi:hypothetical protein
MELDNFKTRGAIHPRPEGLGFLASKDKDYWTSDTPQCDAKIGPCWGLQGAVEELQDLSLDARKLGPLGPR